MVPSGVNESEAAGCGPEDVAVELAGQPETMRQAVRSLALFGRAVMVALSDQTWPVAPYQDLINREAEIVGCSDHLASELPLLIELVRRGRLNLAPVVTATVPLDAGAINLILNRLERHQAGPARTVIVPF